MKALAIILTVSAALNAQAAFSLKCEKNTDGVQHDLVVQGDSINATLEYSYSSSAGEQAMGSLGINCSPTVGFSQVAVKSGGMGGKTTIVGTSKTICRAVQDNLIEVVLFHKSFSGGGLTLSSFKAGHALEHQMMAPKVIEALKGADCLIE